LDGGTNVTARLKARERPAKAVLKTPLPPGRKKSAPPWSLSVGLPCTFYYEGGHGERYWSGGWRYGFIREIPIKGQHKNWVRIELPMDHYAIDEVKGRRVRRLLPHERPWVFSGNVNEPGDFLYHGPKLDEIVAARRAEKAKDIAKASKARAIKSKNPLPK
jgi:hypothetical protein